MSTLYIIIPVVIAGLIKLGFFLTRGRRHEDAPGLIESWARNNQCTVAEVRRAPFWSLNSFVLKHASSSGSYRVTFRDQRGDLINGWASPVTHHILSDPVLEIQLDW
jgi:hypothetical protein